MIDDKVVEVENEKEDTIEESKEIEIKEEVIYQGISEEYKLEINNNFGGPVWREEIYPSEEAESWLCDVKRPINW